MMTTQTTKVKNDSITRIRLREWENATPDQNPELHGLSFKTNNQARQIARKLSESDVLHITEMRDGIAIRSTSHVGRIQLGDLQITIQPKLKLNVFLTLFRYAYNLRDLRIVSDTELTAEPDAFQDILIEQLAAEASELIARGLHRQYRRTDENLSVPKGRIDLHSIAKRGGMIEASIPVIHHPRSEDGLINQVLLSGLYFAVSLTGDLVLRSRLRRIAKIMEADVSRIELNLTTLRQLRRESSRLTSHYDSAITLIELLFRSTGITLEAADELVLLPGFLFDMNLFFERLLSRFFNDYLRGYTVNDQYRLSGMMTYLPDNNPRKRKAPTPRPDFVITEGRKVVAILDAKYRDLWEKSLPRDMLYQLAIYALSQSHNRKSVILYPSIDSDPKPQIIEIREPLYGANSAHITLRSINLPQISELLRLSDFKTHRQLETLAEQLVFGNSP